MMFRVVEIEINTYCNRKCSYCPNSIEDRIEDGDMSEDVFSQITNSLQQINYQGIVSFHFYGEPLLSKNLEKYILELKSKVPECEILLYSNGTRLTYQKFVELVHLGVDRFTITKQETEKDDYVFDKTWLLLDDNLRKRVNYQNYKELDYTNRAGMLENMGQDLLVSMPCFLPMRMLVVTKEGNVLPCYEDFRQELVMGNIIEDDLLSIWEGKKFSSFRNVMKTKEGRRSHSPCLNCNNFNTSGIL